MRSPPQGSPQRPTHLAVGAPHFRSGLGVLDDPTSSMKLVSWTRTFALGDTPREKEAGRSRHTRESSSISDYNIAVSVVVEPLPIHFTI